MTRPPYRAAALAALAVLAGYVFSLAPSVTFWDAGEFIASMKTLGVPHPPGTPLFVILGHVWASVLPFGEYAWRTNLMSALFSAAAAGFWYLIAHEVLERVVPGDEPRLRWLRTAGAWAATLLSAFTFTNWQNSNETEVYAVAALIVASIAWLCLRWRQARDDPRAARFLLLIVYLLGISIANHLLALLAGPAVIAFFAAVLLGEGHPDPRTRRREIAKAAVLAGLWALLLGVGLGSKTLAGIGLVLFLGCAAFAATAGAFGFALLALAIALVGVTPYLFIYLRAAQDPMINESAASTWKALLDVIRRTQYPPRTPLDDPTQLSGPNNPGRNMTLIGLQLINYLQYFDWQWAKALGGKLGSVPLRIVPTILFFWLGLQGSLAHRRADRSSWWLVFALWLVTGLGLVAYMNFRPGFSVGYKEYPQSGDHEVRERDYFFVLSFITWGVWAGIGLTQLVRRWSERLVAAARPAAAAAFALVLVPPIANFREADRGHGPDARLAGDFAYDLLNSAPPYGILFTFGDNDTFPLWWAQEVAGIRKDVRVVCLALARTEWYIRQLRDYADRPFEPERAPAIWREAPAVKPSWPVHTMTNAEISNAVPQILPRPVTLGFGPFQSRLDSNTVVYTEDFLTIRVIQQNFGRRPVAWGLTSGGKYYGLDSLNLIMQRGLGMHLESTPANPSDPNLDFRGSFGLGVPFDIKATERLAFDTYRYADLLTRPKRELESTAAGIAQTLAVPFTQLAFGAESRGDFTAMVRALERASRLSSNPQLQLALEEAKRRVTNDSGPTLPLSR